MTASPNPDALLTLLGRTASTLRRARLRFALRILLVTTGAMLVLGRAAGLLGASLDSIRAAGVLAMLLTTVGALGALAWALRPVPRDEAARLLDRHHALRDAMASAVAFQSHHPADPLERLHILRATELAGRLAPPRGLVRHRAWTFAAAGVWMALGLLLMAAPPSRAPLSAGEADVSWATGDEAPASMRGEPPPDARPPAPALARGPAGAIDPIGAAGEPDAGTSPRAVESGVPPQGKPGGPAASSLPGASPGGTTGGAASTGGQDAVAAREDLAQALSALFQDAPDRPDDTVSQGGVGLPPSKRPRRVESPRGGSEAGRTHLAFDDRPGAPQGDVARIRQDGARGGTLPPPPADGGWTPSGADPDSANRAIPAHAAVRAEPGAAAPTGRESVGEEEGTFDPKEGPVPRVLVVKPGDGTSLTGRAGGRGEPGGDPVPTTFERAAVPLRVLTTAGPPGRESARDATRPDSALVPALRAYALYLNRSHER